MVGQSGEVEFLESSDAARKITEQTDETVAQVSQRLAEFGFTDQRDLDLIDEDVRFTLPPELATIAPAPRR